MSKKRFAERSMIPIVIASIVLSSSVTYFVATYLNVKLAAPTLPKIPENTLDNIQASLADDADRVSFPTFEDAEDKEFIAREARRRIREEMNDMDRTAAKYAFERLLK